MKTISRWFMNNVIWLGTSILCRIEKDELSKIPASGPLIIVANHIGSLEVPLLFVHLQPRRMIGLAKIETWNSKFMGWLFDLWEAIPVRRGEADIEAMRTCIEVLKRGDILVIAPEGTRSYNGKLLRGQPGVALLALRTGVPILPIAHWGGEDFSKNLKRIKRTPFHIRVGPIFHLDPNKHKVTSDLRQTMADEIMGQIARLMPEEYQGEYASFARTTEFLRFS